nr:Chain D, antagonistic peptide [synthetic construct]2QBX_P Chain P, antagonistic peptide [synthetic construct]
SNEWIQPRLPQH